MSALGERLVTRYIKHPPAASSFWQDGDALDSGSGQIVDSDITHLEYESPRILVSSNGPGALAGYQNPGDAWAGMDDVAAPAGPTATWGVSVAQIPWDRRTAVRFGPTPLIADYDIASGVTARQIKVRLDAVINAAVTSGFALFALTAGPSAQALAEGDYLAFTAVSFGGTGAKTATATLTLDAPLAGSLYEPVRVRSGGASGDAYAYVARGYVWFGWALLGTTLTSTIVSLSAWETRT